MQRWQRSRRLDPRRGLSGSRLPGVSRALLGQHTGHSSDHAGYDSPANGFGPRGVRLARIGRIFAPGEARPDRGRGLATSPRRSGSRDPGPGTPCDLFSHHSPQPSGPNGRLPVRAGRQTPRIQDLRRGLPMEIVMPPVSLESREDLACVKCGRRASFLSPIGPFCPTDALLAAAFHAWIPIQIRHKSDGKGDTPSATS